MKALLVLVFFFGWVDACHSDSPTKDKSLAVLEKSNPPEELKDFWTGFHSEWLPQTENDYWTPAQQKFVQNYCKTYASHHKPTTVIPSMIIDLRTRESLIRTSIYVWVVLHWDPETTKPILERYYSGNDPLNKQIAGDLLAEVQHPE